MARRAEHHHDEHHALQVPAAPGWDSGELDLLFRCHLVASNLVKGGASMTSHGTYLSSADSAAVKISPPDPDQVCGACPQKAQMASSLGYRSSQA